MERFDCIIIGGGVVGCAIARELTRYRWSVAVLEKASDVAAGTSGRNSGVLHAGFNNKPGTLMAECCVEGSAAFPETAKELDVPFRRTGKLVTALTEEELPGMEKLYQQGLKNGVPGMELIDGDEIRRLEPNVDGIAALSSTMTGVLDPMAYTIALAENAQHNGARILLETAVVSLEEKPGEWRVHTRNTHGEDGVLAARWIVNSAGLFSDQVARMAGIDEYTIYPCRGEYYVMDERLSQQLGRPVYPVPNPKVGGLGVHLTTTYYGNILLGPSAEYILTRGDYATTGPVMDKLYREARAMFPLVEARDFIRSYAGIRSKLVGPSVGGFGDFVIERRDDHPGFVNLVGIESPGLTSAGPISKRVAALIDQKEHLEKKPQGEFDPIRRAVPRFNPASAQERAALVAQDPNYGEVICRCNKVTKAQILAAIHNPLGAHSLAAIKYRTGALMGRCQSGYCLTRIVELMRQQGIPLEEIREREPGSEWFYGELRGGEKA